MNGDLATTTQPQQTPPSYVTLTGPEAQQILALAPAWARAMNVRREKDGRIVLVGETDGCYLWVQPKAWALMNVRPTLPTGEAAVNYGVQMAGMQQHSGRLETNDPKFGPELLSGRHDHTTSTVAEESPLPLGNVPGMNRDQSMYAGILAGALILVALIIWVKRKAR